MGDPLFLEDKNLGKHFVLLCMHLTVLQQC